MLDFSRELQPAYLVGSLAIAVAFFWPEQVPSGLRITGGNEADL